MFGVDELHLLNIAVDQSLHGQGLGGHMLHQLVSLCHAHRLATIWLEVRPSNARAKAVYERHGYAAVGLRKNYYPTPEGREDAVVMKREVRLDSPLV
jgi:ribosomal-protein-alanine N-acetyltransferase